ncbi:MAG TPA: DUF4265 domain-containing protein [Trebonia sp.]|nr:DUF4265 domain-containing protein [Trebonia sp.]
MKVVFELPRDGDGWPPVASEGLWAVQVGPDVARLDNTPFFALRVAFGDLVRIHPAADGQLWAGDVLQPSGHCTIRVIPFPDGPLGSSRQRVLDAFAPLGVTCEGAEQFGLVALDVPPEADLPAVRRLLRDGERGSWWEYDEGCITGAWQAAAPD